MESFINLIDRFGIDESSDSEISNYSSDAEIVLRITRLRGILPFSIIANTIILSKADTTTSSKANITTLFKVKIKRLIS